MNSASLNEIANNIRNLIRGGRSSNTDHISLEQIKHQVKYYRALFIRRDMERNFDRSNMFEQDLGHVQFEVKDSAETPAFSSGVIVCRSTKQIPTPVRLKSKEAITHISSDDTFGIQIPLIDSVKAPWQQYNKYTADKSFAMYRDGYLYIYNDVTINRAYVRGIFEDPEKVHDFTRENGIDLYDDNSPFPISSDMLEGIVKGMINGELKLLGGTLNDDETNLSQDEQ